MEIVPILSTIILVGTVATFILAVAAYVLYKMRELRGNAVEKQEPQQVDPHVLMAVRQPGMMMHGGDSAPAEAQMYMAPTGTLPHPGQYVEMSSNYAMPEGGDSAHLPQRAAAGMPLSSFFWEYTDDGFIPRTPAAGNGRAASAHRAEAGSDGDAA
ncbi:MAG: hypothetical protein R2834_09850 [Rhodothermales bacterium]